jgi:perosamine synthetase
MIEQDVQQIPILDAKGKPIDLALLWELKHIPLSAPDITQKEIKLITQVLLTPYLSIGPRIKEFEIKISKYLKIKYAIAVNSGTSALHLCVRSLNIHDGDEVITTPFSFIASANCILFERATPVFVDIDPETLCLDPKKIEAKITKRTKAILPVHIFGHPADMDPIMEIARCYKLYIIEDACEAIGSEYKNKKVGSFGDVSTFAFYPNKQMTTAEGGLVVTNNKKIADLCKSLRNQGRDENHKWLSHERLGFNYRMSEINAALGVVQTGRLHSMLKKREKVASMYTEKIKNMTTLSTPAIAPYVTKMSWFVYVIRLNPSYFDLKDRNCIINELQKKGIACNTYFPPIHLQPFYQKLFHYKTGDYAITETISRLTIALPFYNNLTDREIEYICDTLKNILTAPKYNQKNKKYNT